MCCVWFDEEFVFHELKDCIMARCIWQASSLERVIERRFASLVDWWNWVSGELEVKE